MTQIIASLAFVKNALKTRISFSAITPSLYLIMLISFTAHSNYADITYSRGLKIESLMRVNSVFYLHASKYQEVESIGLGVGYRFDALNMVATVIDEDGAKVWLNATYNDKGVPYFFGIKSGDEIGFKIGTGYPLNEKVGVIVYYSDDGLFFGVRRWM